MFSAEDRPIEPPPNEVAASRSGLWFGELEQRDFDVDFYRRILHRQPNDVRMLRLLGELYARQGRHDLAVEVDQKLVELAPDEAVARYNLACSLAMQNETAQALSALNRALELGYNDFGQLEVDPDLHRLRQLPEFKTLAQRYRFET